MGKWMGELSSMANPVGEEMSLNKLDLVPLEGAQSVPGNGTNHYQ